MTRRPVPLEAGRSDPTTAPLEPLEIAAGMVFEPPVKVRRPELTHGGRGARRALEDVVLAHLTEGRGSVSFSGGRDSSLVLAIACHVARREGLPEPVAITSRHRSPESDETSFQEMVVRHLRLADWVTVDVEDTMDVLGPTATGILEQFGVQAPPNAYLHVPMYEVAPPGVLLTGAGGDEVLGTRAGRPARVLFGRTRPRPHDLVRLAAAVAPSRLKRLRERRRPWPWTPWLSPEADAAVRDRMAITTSQYGLRWDLMTRRFARSRFVRLGTASLEAISATRGVGVASPLMDPVFVDAFTSAMGAAGPASRTAAMYHLAGDLLPKEVLERESKAAFGAVVWGPRFRRFVTDWSASDLPVDMAGLVDADRLAASWSEAQPPFPSMMLVQHAWLSARRRGAQGLDRREGRV